MRLVGSDLWQDKSGHETQKCLPCPKFAVYKSFADNYQPRTVDTIAYQPALRPALPCVYGPLEYREQRGQFERIDAMLRDSGLEEEFIRLAVLEAGLDVAAMSVRQQQRFARTSVLALRCNIARELTGLATREFCVRLADSPLLQWFLQVGEMGGIRAFSKSSCDRFGRWVGKESLRAINDKLVALLTAPRGSAKGAQRPPAVALGLSAPIECGEVFFDSTCLQANLHFPVDWVLLRDAARTLMKATVLIRRHGLRQRMPKEPLEFLSEMNTLCMKMGAKPRHADGKKHRKRVLREMKALERRIADHARAHLELLESHWQQTALSEGQARGIMARIKLVLEQLPAAIRQAHERIIGERRLANEAKILSLYDDALNVMVRGKAGAQVEFGNKLWLGETRRGVIVDYQLYRDNPGDSALVEPALQRLVEGQGLAIAKVWGDRGLASQDNSAMLARRGIGDGLCPRDPAELARRLEREEGFRAGLKRRAGTEARVGVFKNVFLGRPLPAKGFGHRELAVGWAVLSHNLWVAARLAEAAARRPAAAPRNRPPPKPPVA